MPDPLLDALSAFHDTLIETRDQVIARIDIALRQVEDAMEATKAFRKCRKCGGVFPVEYYSKKNNTNRRATICVECVSVEANERRGVRL